MLAATNVSWFRLARLSAAHFLVVRGRLSRIHCNAGYSRRIGRSDQQRAIAADTDFGLSYEGAGERAGHEGSDPIKPLTSCPAPCVFGKQSDNLCSASGRLTPVTPSSNDIAAKPGDGDAASLSTVSSIFLSMIRSKVLHGTPHLSLRFRPKPWTPCAKATRTRRPMNW